MADTLSFFLSCPDDVCLEQSAAEQVVRRLRDQYARHMRIAEPATGRSLFGTANSTFNHGFINDFDVIVVVLWMRPPVAEFLTALEHLQSKTPTDLLIYLRTSAFNAEDMSVIEQQQLADDVQRLDDFCVMLRSHPHVSPRVWKEFTDADSFTDQLEFDLERYIEGHLFGDAQPAVCWDANPFVGLESFGPGQAMIFCGRDAAVQEALTELQRRASAPVSLPSLLIVGASGTGKSSLARCGLAGRIGLLFPTAPQIELRPGDGSGSALIQRLGAELMRLFPDHGLRLNELMLRDPAAAVMQLERLRPNLTSSHHEPVFVLIVDQLEELFTPQPDADDLRQFATMLDLLVRRGLCWCIATLRSDCLGRLSDVKSFSHFTENGGVYVLPQPTPSEIRSMIRRPARLAGVQYEQQTDSGETLADRILRDVPRGSSGLPLLQFTLRKLYDERSASGSLTYRAYTSLGGLLGCVAAHAESVFSKLAVHEQQVFAVVFRELVRVSTDDRLPARQRCRLLVFDGNTAAMGLVQALISARLLVRDDEHGVATVELVHESLLQTWPRLRDWLNVEGELLRKRLRLLEAYERWSHSHRTSDLLLPRGTALDEANEVLSAGLLSAEHDRSSLVRRFIRQSQRAVQRIQRQRRRAADLLADSQLKSLELSIDSVSDSLESLEQLAAKELDADRLPNTLQYLHEAELLATTRRGELLRQIEERLTVPERNNRADSGFAARLQALRQRVSDSLFLDPEYWRHREANILREFPELVWRRNLRQSVSEATISPDRKRLLLITTEHSNDVAMVWDLETNMPTPCCLSFRLTQSYMHATWAADSRSFFIFSEPENSPGSTGFSVLMRVDAATGEILTAPISHRGLILRVALSDDGCFLTVVNYFDGTHDDYCNWFRENSRNVPNDSPESSSEMIQSSATITRYDTTTMTATQNVTLGFALSAATVQNDWIAVLPHEQVWIRHKDARLVYFFNISTEEEYIYGNAAGGSALGMSQDGRFLALTHCTGGFVLLERTEAGIVERATAGSNPRIENIIVRTRSAGVGKGVAVDIVMSDVRHQETPAALIETSQRIAAYSYFPQTGQLINSLLGDSDGLITCLELQKNWGDHERVVVGSKNGKARVWQREPGRFLTPSLALSGTPLLVDFSAPGPDFLHPFVSVTDDGEISYWNLHTNALRETLDEGVISRQRLYVHSGRSDTAKWRLLSQSPDESCGISVSEDSTFRGYVQLEFNLSPELTSVIDAGISVEKVLWSHDSRYAVLIEGQSPVDEQGASSLLQNDFLNSRAGRSTSVPVQSRLAIIDLETRNRLGSIVSFDGPIIDIRMMASHPAVLIACLLLTDGEGHIEKISLANQARESLYAHCPLFCSVSPAADCTTIAMLDLQGRPLILRQNCSSLPIFIRDSAPIGYQTACLTDSGDCAAFLPRGHIYPVKVVNLKNSASYSILETKRSRGFRAISPVPGQELFVLTGSVFEVVVISGTDGTILHRVHVGSRIAAVAFSRDGRLMAALDLNRMVHVLDTATWHPVSQPGHPSLFIPLSEWPIDRPPEQFEFSRDGNLLLSAAVSMKQLLSPVPQSPSVERSIRSLASGKMDRDEAADWLDDYFHAGAFAAEDHERALHIIRKHSLPLSGDSPFALKKALRQIAIATAAGNVPAWREAVAWMASDANSFRGLNASDLGMVVKHIRFLSVETALSSLPVAVSAASRSQGNPFAGFGLNLALGNTLAALGSFTEAARFFMLALNSEVAATIRQIDRRSIAIVLQRALCGVWSGEDPQHMAAEFRNFLTDEDPDVVVAFRYFRYLAGFSTVTGTDVIIPPPAISHQVSLFHELCHHLEQDGDAALKSVQELVASSLDCFELGSLQAPPNTFPVLRAHCRLFEADVLLRLKRDDEAQQAMQAANSDWIGYCQQLIDLGLDPRALWVERLGYELLKARIEAQVADIT